MTKQQEGSRMDYSVATMRDHAKAIFASACQEVNARECIHRAMGLTGDELRVGDRLYDLKNFERVLVVGAGKASTAMARAVEEILGDRISAGHINTKYGFAAPLDKIQWSECAHPIPDQAGVEGTEKILDLLAGADDRTLVLCLISGGGSALMPAPVAGISLDDKQETTRLLLGANIKELNAIRKHLSLVKGGQLARKAFPATVAALTVSDVTGDPLDVIASGPTVPDTSTFADCAAILQKYGVADKVPASVRDHFAQGIGETPKPGDEELARCHNLIIGNIHMAVAAARQKAAQLGYNTLVLATGLEGEARDIAHIYTALAKELTTAQKPVPAPACIIAGGETTVTLHEGAANGKGGRNQALVLAGAIELAGRDGIVLFSGGTDGDDGVKDADDPGVAGALADGRTIARGQTQGLDATAHLDANNAYPFFQALRDHVITGPTDTNVMDIALLLVGDTP